MDPKKMSQNESKRIVVLGGYGSMGRIIVRDLSQYAKQINIAIAGRDEKKARAFIREVGNPSIEFVSCDVNDIRQTSHALRGATVCINAVQYELNEKIMRACLLAKCHYLDLGGLFHMTKKQLKWHGKFKRAGLLAVLGMGAAPGVTNILAKIGMDRLDSIEGVFLRVGGRDFTKVKNPPVLWFSYSPKTILEEHSIPPMIFRKGKFEQIPARSMKSQENFGGKIGTCTTMATLHSEVLTLSKYKPSIRACDFQISFPDDFEDKISLLVEAGFAKPENIDYTAKILSQISKPKVKANDIETLRARIHGKKNGKPKIIIVDATFKSLSRWNAGGGDVDTGVPPSIVAQMIAHGKIESRGVLPPEQCIPVKPFLHELKRRGMKLRVSSQ